MCLYVWLSSCHPFRPAMLRCTWVSTTPCHQVTYAPSFPTDYPTASSCRYLGVGLRVEHRCRNYVWEVVAVRVYTGITHPFTVYCLLLTVRISSLFYSTDWCQSERVWPQKQKMLMVVAISSDIRAYSPVISGSQNNVVQWQTLYTFLKMFVVLHTGLWCSDIHTHLCTVEMLTCFSCLFPFKSFRWRRLMRGVWW